MDHKDKILVAIYMLTYNHEKYVAQCIESVLNQKLNGNLLLVIGEDCSTDETRKICLEYKNKYPERIHLILHTPNVGPVENGKSVYNYCIASGAKYIAPMDGDDYWTDEYKIQKQVDFLDANPEYVVSYHNAIQISDDPNFISSDALPESEQRDYSASELIKGPWLLVCTLFYRNVIQTLPKEIDTVMNQENFLTVLLGEHGAGKFQKEILPSVYRVHSGGIWSGVNQEKQWNSQAHTYFQLVNYFKRKNKVNQVKYFLDLYLKKKKAVYNLQLKEVSNDAANNTKKETLKNIKKFAGWRVYFACRNQFKSIQKSSTIN